MTEDAATTSILVVVAVSTDQGATKVLEGMVIEKRLPNFLSLLESYAGDATPEVPVVPRPPIPTPHLSSYKESGPPTPWQHWPLALPIFKKEEEGVSDTNKASKQITKGCTYTN